MIFCLRLETQKSEGEIRPESIGLRSERPDGVRPHLSLKGPESGAASKGRTGWPSSLEQRERIHPSSAFLFQLGA